MWLCKAYTAHTKYSGFLLSLSPDPTSEDFFFGFPSLKAKQSWIKGLKGKQTAKLHYKSRRATSSPTKGTGFAWEGTDTPSNLSILPSSSKPRNTTTKQRAEKCCFLFHTYSAVKKKQCHKNRDATPRFSSCSLSRSKIYTTAHVMCRKCTEKYVGVGRDLLSMP